MDPFSLTLLSAALAAGMGGLVAVIKKGVQVILAERKFVKEASVKRELVSSHSQLNELALDSQTMRQLVTSLVRETNLSDAEKKLLLDGLEQPSQAGQQRYAQKLYQELETAK